MATIGNVGIAFTAETAGLQNGVAGVVSALGGVQSAADALSSRLSSLSDSSIGISVDTSALKTATKEVERFSAKDKIAKSIEIDKEKTKKTLEESQEESQKEADKKKITFTATIKDAFSKGMEAAKKAAEGVAEPIEASKSSLEGLYGAAKEISSAFGSATKGASLLRDAVIGVGTGGKALRSLVVSAGAFSSAWQAAGSSLSGTRDGVSGLVGALAEITELGADSEALTKTLASGAAAFTATSVTSAAAAAAIKLVESATSKLDPALQSSVRLLAGLGIAAAQTATSKRLAAASSKVFSAALSAEVSPLAAVSTFLDELGSGFAAVAEASQTAARFQSLYAEAAAVSGRAISSAIGAAKSFYAAVASVVSALGSSISGTAKAAASSSLLRTVYYDVGIAAFAAADAMVSALNSFSAGRAATSLLSKGVGVLSSAFGDAVGFVKAFWSAASAGFASLPGATSAIAALSKAITGLGAALGGATSGMSGLNITLRSLGPLFQVAAVATGAYSQQLKAAADGIESVTNLSQRFGTSVASVEILAQAADAAGVSMGLLVKAQQTLFQNASKIKFGQVDSESVREAQISLSRLGITVEDIQSLRPEQLFAVVAERLQGVEDATDRAAISFDLFGKSGAAILPALAGLEKAKQDAERFGTATSKIDLSRLQGLDDSFDRLSAASQALGGTMLAPLVPLQTGWNNLLADIKGGLNRLLGPINTFIASGTVGFQVLFEVIGRVVNILLRLGGAIAEVITAFLAAPTLAVGWQALGSAIMDVLAVVESLVSVVERVAGAISSQLVPSAEQLSKSVDLSAPSKTVGEWGNKLLIAGKYLGIIVVSAGAAQAAAVSFGVTAGASAISVAAKNAIASISFAGLWKAAVTAFKFITFGAVKMASSYVSSLILMATTTLSSFIAPFLAAVASFVTGSTVIATSATVTGVAVAAAWAIATLGIGLLIAAVAALILNFDQVYDYFANFGENSKRLFTLDGLTEVASAVASAIFGVFQQAGMAIVGLFSSIVQGIADAVMGIETPEIANAAKADAEQIAAVRRKAQEAEFQRAQKIADLSNSASKAAASMSFGIVDFGQIEMPEMPVDETEKIVAAIDSSREAMRGAVIDAAKFGETGKKAALDAQQQFAKLQQKLAEGTLTPERFEEEAKKIRESLQRNLQNLDILSDSDIFDFAKVAQDSAKEALKEVDKVFMGQDLGSTFEASRYFPSSAEIREAAARFAVEYEQRNKEIARKLAAGEFGEGQQAKDNANSALAASQERFRRDMGKIEADVSFASEIRKALEDAFLSPLQKYEKRLKEIQDNKSLTDQEKSLATVQANQQMVRDTFGTTAGQSLREREELFAKANQVDQYGRTAFFSETGNRAEAEARSSAVRTQLDIERRSAAGLDATITQQLKAGADRVADAFDVTGLSMGEIQKKLSPEQFAEYQEAMKKNRDRVLESLGVQKAGVVSLRELQKDLAEAGATAAETSQAMRKANENFMQSLGIEQTPFEKFSSSLDNIAEQFDMAGVPIDQVRERLKGNAEQLALFDRAVKTARDNLLSSLGVEKSPQQVFEETMARIDEARNATDPNKRITGEQAAQAEIEAFRRRDEALGAGDNATVFGADFVKQQKAIEEAFGKGGEKNPEKFALAMEKLRQSIPGAEPTSPLVEFRNQLAKLEEVRSVIGEDAFQQNKLGLQAQLQEQLVPALDATTPDRRLVGAADVRSKEGVDTFFRILQGRDNPSLKAQLEIARNTRLLAEAARDPEAAPVIAQLGAR